MVSALLDNAIVEVEFPFGSFGATTDCSTLEIEANLLNYNGKDYETMQVFNSTYFRRHNVVNNCLLIMNKTLVAFNETTYNDLHTI